MRVLFVCLGNICRSPAGEALLKKYAREEGLADFQAESSGLGSWWEGKGADPRMREAAARRGLELDGRARSFDPSFFDQFDQILAADQSVLADLCKRARSPEDLTKIALIGTYGNRYRDEDVPDPFHGEAADFERALDVLEDHCRGFILSLKEL